MLGKGVERFGRLIKQGSVGVDRTRETGDGFRIDEHTLGDRQLAAVVHEVARDARKHSDQRAGSSAYALRVLVKRPLLGFRKSGSDPDGFPFIPRKRGLPPGRVGIEETRGALLNAPHVALKENRASVHGLKRQGDLRAGSMKTPEAFIGFGDRIERLEGLDAQRCISMHGLRKPQDARPVESYECRGIRYARTNATFRVDGNACEGMQQRIGSHSEPRRACVEVGFLLFGESRNNDQVALGVALHRSGLSLFLSSLDASIGWRPIEGHRSKRLETDSSARRLLLEKAIVCLASIWNRSKSRKLALREGRWRVRSLFRRSETERRAFARRYNCTTLVRSFTKSLMLYIIRHSQVGSPRLRGKDNLRGPQDPRYPVRG